MNKNDAKLLEFCRGSPKTMKEISQHLKIAIKNVSVKIRELQNKGLVIIEKNPVLKKLTIQTKQDTELESEMNRLLKIIKDNGGEISLEELGNKAYEKINLGNKDEVYITTKALIQVRYSRYVQEFLKLRVKEG